MIRALALSTALLLAAGTSDLVAQVDDGAGSVPEAALAPDEGSPPTPASAAPIPIEEWDVPWENTRPRDPYVGPDGRVWFVGQRGDYIGVLDPSTGDFRRYELDPGTGPHNLIVDDDGTVWYAGNRAAHIGKLDPGTGEIHKIPTESRDPHTLTFAPDGNIWFTAQGANRVGHLNTETEEVREIDVPTASSRPYGIIVAPDGRPWIVQVGSNIMGTVDPSTMEYREIELPREDARPRRIGRTNDGRIWYVDYGMGYVGAYDPSRGEFEEWLAPSGEESNPYGMAVDAEDRIWFVETGVSPNVFVGFDPETEEFFDQTPVPSGGGTVRHMYFDAGRGAIWFGADTNTIGRARVP